MRIIKSKKDVKNKDIKKIRKPNKRKLLEKKIWELCSLLCRKKANMLCEICGKVGTQSHHHFSKKAFPRMKYEINQLIWLCYFCHIRRVHQQGQYELARDVLVKRLGENGFLELKKRAYERYTGKPKVGNTIKDLEDRLNELMEM